MTHGDDAVDWVLKSLVSMFPRIQSVAKTTMSDLEHVVKSNLVENTVDKSEWESLLSEACRKWPDAAQYLQSMTKHKERWGYLWRMENFTLGYQASSPAESSFSEFKRSIGDQPKSFVGVVQTHMKKDEDKMKVERKAVSYRQVEMHNSCVNKNYSDAANQCRQIYSHKISEIFHQNNLQSLNYVATPVRGFDCCFEVSRRIGQNKSAWIVDKVDGKWRCSCKEVENIGVGSCRHIQ
ncbi:hypothetical protein ACHAXN_000061, partial [Cyclotella atomus]